MNGKTLPLGILLLVGLLFLAGSLGATQTDLPEWEEHTPWLQSAKITPNDTHEPGQLDSPHHGFAWFGSSMDTDGERLIVAAPGIDAAYIFEPTEDGWEQTAKLGGPQRILAPTASADDVAISSKIAVLGAPVWPDLDGGGAVFIFEEVGPHEWEMVQRLEEEPEDNDRFGHSVAVEGDTIVVGAFQKDSNGKLSGSVFIYERGEEGWSLTAEFKGEDQRAFLGRTVDMQDGIAVAAATDGDFRDDQRGGAVHVYEKTGGVWVQTETLFPPVPTESFGFDLDFDGEKLIVGAGYSDRLRGERVHGTAAFGKAFIFERQENGWALTADLDNPAPIPRDPYGLGLGGEKFGTSVGIDDDIAVVGALSAEPRRAGAAYVYEQAENATGIQGEGGWDFSGRLVYEEPWTADKFGAASAVLEDRVVVGAMSDTNREDGVPYPLSNRDWIPGLGNSGASAGSVYEFSKATMPERLGG